MEPSEHDFDASQLAEWLERQAGDRYWTVDGDPRISGEISLPVKGMELAALLRALGGRIRIYADPAKIRESVSDLGVLAEEEDDQPTFEMAWVDNDSPGARWLLMVDRIAEEISQGEKQPS